MSYVRILSILIKHSIRVTYLCKASLFSVDIYKLLVCGCLQDRSHSALVIRLLVDTTNKWYQELGWRLTRARFDHLEGFLSRQLKGSRVFDCPDLRQGVGGLRVCWFLVYQRSTVGFFFLVDSGLLR